VVTLGATIATGAPAAHADAYSLHVLGSAQVAWTDNLFSVPDEGLATTPHEGDVYYQFRPGVLGTYETPRSVHQLSYDLEANLYSTHNEAWSLQHLGAWRGFFMLTPRSELGASLSVSTGTLTSLSTRGTAADGTIVALPSGENRFLSLDASQHLSFTPTRELRLTQGALGRSFSTTDALGAESTGIEVGLNGGADRGWKYSAVSLHLSGSFVSLAPTAAKAPGVATGEPNTSAVASWRRDFGPRWTALFDAGITSIIPLDEGDQLVIQPTVGAQASYAPNWGSAGLAIRRAVAPNLYLAQNTISDSVIANAWLPLPWLARDPHQPKLSVQGTVGANRTQLIDTSTGAIESGFDVLSADVALNYVPREGVSVALRAQHIRQVADDASIMEVVGYDRTTILIAVTGRFPDRLAAEIPARDSLRVDRSNVTPIGDEVAPAQAPGAP